ncbi:MAG: DUF1538 domain-containing protein [Methylococcaceae bacterium]|nr:DUF1538 domain-containing protein [Methylococcaceae bacterium]MCI0732572.1 DUF1538 domain-containing protein [Methylococcaceae bacterium]
MFSIRNPFLRNLVSSFFDLVPILAVVLVFQLLVIRQPLANIGELLTGTALVVVGLTFLIHGLEQGLFPIGESMAAAFARKGSLTWMIAFAFALGFGTTIAEPTLIAIADKASGIAAGSGMIEADQSARENFALGLRLSVASAIGFALILGVLRIILGWPVQTLIIAGFLGIIVMTPFAPKQIVGIAYDSGGVATSTITVPLVTALGVGLASSIRSRNPMADGFGLIAFAALCAMNFVMLYGLLI